MKEETLKTAVELSKKRERLQMDREKYLEMRNHIASERRKAVCQECFHSDKCTMCNRGAKVTAIAFMIDGREYLHNLCHEAFSDLVKYAIERVDSEIASINQQINNL